MPTPISGLVLEAGQQNGVKRELAIGEFGKELGGQKAMEKRSVSRTEPKFIY